MAAINKPNPDNGHLAKAWPNRNEGVVKSHITQRIADEDRHLDPSKASDGRSEGSITPLATGDRVSRVQVRVESHGTKPGHRVEALLRRSRRNHI